jgi:hypothetical protein
MGVYSAKIPTRGAADPSDAVFRTHRSSLQTNSILSYGRNSCGCSTFIEDPSRNGGGPECEAEQSGRPSTLGYLPSSEVEVGFQPTLGHLANPDRCRRGSNASVIRLDETTKPPLQHIPQTPTPASTDLLGRRVWSSHYDLEAVYLKPGRDEAGKNVDPVRTILDNSQRSVF